MASKLALPGVWSPSPAIRGSSNGRTAAFGAAHLGSNPCPRTTVSTTTYGRADRTTRGNVSDALNMKLDKSTSLFFATKIDSKLREGLALSKPGDKKYFDGSSEEFLRVMEIGDEKDKERWIGKIIKPGPAVTEVDDIQRNILSILRRVAPNARIPASAVKIFVLQGAHGTPAVIDDEAEGDEVDGSSGPYITY